MKDRKKGTNKNLSKNAKIIAIICFTIFTIGLFILIIWLIILDPGRLIILLVMPIMTIVIWYNNKLASDMNFKSLKKPGITDEDLSKNLEEIYVTLNTMIDKYELNLLMYLRIFNYRLKVIRNIIYFLLVITIVFYFLNPIYFSFPGFSEMQSMISVALTLLFYLYIKFERVKFECRRFKKWIKSVQQELLIIENNSIKKKLINKSKEKMRDLNNRIENYKSNFKNANFILEVIEKISYLFTIVAIIIPPLFNLKMIENLIPNIISVFLFILFFLIPYFYYNIKDARKFRKDKLVMEVKNKLDLVSEKIYSSYFSKKN